MHAVMHAVMHLLLTHTRRTRPIFTTRIGARATEWRASVSPPVFSNMARFNLYTCRWALTFKAATLSSAFLP